MEGGGGAVVCRLIDGLRGCHPQANAHTLCVGVAPLVIKTPDCMVCMYTLSAEPLSQVFMIGHLWVV